MRLVSATEEWVRKYLELAQDRNLPFTIWPSRMALLVAEGKDLVAGVMVYDSTGPFLFFEHLVTNETASYRIRHRAVSLMAGEMMNMCRLMGKVPQVAVKHRGVMKILERVGLRMPGAFMMTCGFNQLEKNDYEINDRNRSPRPILDASEPACGCQGAAATERATRGDTEEYPGIYASVLGGAAV